MSQRNSFLFREFVIGADSFGQLSNGISNSIVSGIVYWLIATIVMGILFIITGWILVWSGYQVGKIYRKYCWDILSIIVAITSAAIVIYFGEWIKICYSCKSYHAVATGACDLYWNSMLCERLAGRTGILLNWNISRSAPAYILFIYRNVKRKQTQKVNPMIEMKKEEIYELCEKGHKLLL